MGSRPCSRTDVSTDPDRAPQIHNLKPLCSCQGLDDKLNRGMGERGREGRSQRQNNGGRLLILCLLVYISDKRGRQGSRLSVRQILLSLLRIMSVRCHVGNYSHLSCYLFMQMACLLAMRPQLKDLRSVFVVFVVPVALRRAV